MRKFCKLVHNEIIKLVKKKSTLIMAALFLAAIVGFTGLCKVIAVKRGGDSSDWRQEVFLDGTVAGNREYYERLYNESVKKGSDGSIVSFDMEAKAAYEYWKFLADKSVRYDDWLYTEGLYEEYCTLRLAVETGTADSAAAARIAVIEGYMTENGWRAYYSDVLAALADNTTEASEREARRWFYTYALEAGIEPVTGEMNEVLNETLDAKLALAALQAKAAAGESVQEERLDAAENAVAMGLYRLEHHVTRDIAAEVKNSSIFMISDFNFWSVLAVCKTFITLVGVMCIVIAGSIVATEFSQGTYKFLLMSPAKRWKILVAKFATVLLFGIAALVVLYLVSLVCCMIFFGTADLALPMLSVSGGVVAATSPLVSLIGDYLLSTVEILAMIMLAFAISTLVKSNALAISASLMVYFFGSMVEQLLRMFGVDFGRYLLFANLDLPALYAGSELYAGQSFGFAIAVILAHLVIFGLTAWDAFTRREM